MKLLTDIKDISLTRFLGIISFGLCFYCIVRQLPPEYVSYSVYLFFGVWGTVATKNFIDMKMTGKK
jgi:hypothetical protein